ncbi:MAG: hypothetical protein PWR03_2363, partial [Tenuifilum sp.]|uniref:S9 family peptidase n=1 Tax=Tenuifilum sp. TaxID=2760880 RepID=UPI0024AAE5DE
MRIRTKPIYFIAMAIIALGSGCSKSDEKSKEPLKIDTSLTQEEKEKGLLTPEIMWKFGRVGNATISPDGKMLAYTTTYYNLKEDRGVTNLYVISTDGGEPVKLTDEQGSESNIQWSADGKTIRFLSSRSGSNQIWEVKTDGTGLKQLTNFEFDINGFNFSPDGSKLIYVKEVKMVDQAEDIHPDMPKAKVRIIDDLMYRHWDTWEDGKFNHLFVADFTANGVENAIDINEGEKWDTPMATGYDIEEVQWSPDGKKIVYASKKLYGKEYAMSTNSDIYLYDLETKETINLTEDNKGYDRYPRFSPNGMYISWWSMETPLYESDQKRLFVLNTSTNEKRYLTKGFDQNVEYYVWDNDSKNIYFTSGIKATEQIYKIDVETAEIKQLTTGVHDYTTCQFANGVLTASRMSMSMATELFRIDENTGEATQLTYTNKHIYDNIKMGEVRERWVTTTDGKKMLVWVILPPDFDSTKKYPALLYCQGGPQSAVSQFWSYRWNFQIMAANGYVVVAPNRRGLPSFGQEWNRQISGDYSGQNIKDYLSAI